VSELRIAVLTLNTEQSKAKVCPMTDNCKDSPKHASYISERFVCFKMEQ
jgi:hypothetical protein